jgi:hypothetical protein
MEHRSELAPEQMLANGTAGPDCPPDSALCWEHVARSLDRLLSVIYDAVLLEYLKKL